VFATQQWCLVLQHHCLGCFAQWLAWHAGLVRSISIKPVGPCDFKDDEEQLLAYLRAAQELLQSTLSDASAQQLAASSMPASATASTGAAATAATTTTTAMTGATVTSDSAGSTQ
jgi:hypothetical protein